MTQPPQSNENGEFTHIAQFILDNVAWISAVALGMLLFAAKFLGRQKSEDISDNEPKSYRPISYSSQSQNQFLSLVVGANAKDLCEKLRSQQKINPEDWQELYTKTQDLLLIDKSLDDLLSSRGESITSEYSVFIISIDLDWSKIENAEFIKPGFKVGASSLDREDAFEQLPHIARNVQVSQCLPPISYQGRGFYQC